MSSKTVDAFGFLALYATIVIAVVALARWSIRNRKRRTLVPSPRPVFGPLRYRPMPSGHPDRAFKLGIADEQALAVLEALYHAGGECGEYDEETPW